MFGPAARRGDRCFRAVTDRNCGRVAASCTQPDRHRTEQRSPTCMLTPLEVKAVRRRRSKTEKRRPNMHRGRRSRAPRAPSKGACLRTTTHLLFHFLKTRIPTQPTAAGIPAGCTTDFLRSFLSARVCVNAQRRCDAAPCQQARARLLCTCLGIGRKTGRSCVETRAAERSVACRVSCRVAGLRPSLLGACDVRGRR